MNLRLFSKCWCRDFEWLKLAIETVMKHCQDKVFWTIVVDHGEKAGLRLPETDKIIFQVYEIQQHWPEASELGNGYIQQQWVKMNAHRVMGEGFFLNWDSDVMALRDFSVKNFQNPLGKPILWFTPFNDIIPGGDAVVHQARQNYIKSVFNIQEAPFEWMRCMPIWMNSEILRIGSSRREWNIVQSFMRAKEISGLSEFNLIGQLSHMFFPDAYDYKNTQTSEPTWAGPIDSKTAIIHQGYSWGGDHAGCRRILGL